MNRVCSIHEVYCPDGKCKWCEEPAAEPEILRGGLTGEFASLAFGGSVWTQSPNATDGGYDGLGGVPFCPQGTV